MAARVCKTGLVAPEKRRVLFNGIKCSTDSSPIYERLSVLSLAVTDTQDATKKSANDHKQEKSKQIPPAVPESSMPSEVFKYHLLAAGAECQLQIFGARANSPQEVVCIDDASFWSFIYSSRWKDFDCVRVVGGTTLSKLLCDLASLVQDGVLLSNTTVHYDTIDQEEDHESISTINSPECPARNDPESTDESPTDGPLNRLVSSPPAESGDQPEDSLDLVLESCQRHRTPARIELTVYYAGPPAAAADEFQTDECYMESPESRLHRDASKSSSVTLKYSNGTSSSLSLPLDHGTEAGPDPIVSHLSMPPELTAQVAAHTKEDAGSKHSPSVSVTDMAPLSTGSRLSAASAQQTTTSSQQKIALRKEKKPAKKERPPEEKKKDEHTGEGEEVLDYVVHYFDDDAKIDKIELVSVAATDKKLQGSAPAAPVVDKKGVAVPAVTTIDAEQKRLEEEEEKNRRYEDRMFAERLWNVERSPTCRSSTCSFQEYLETRHADWCCNRQFIAQYRHLLQAPLVCHGCTDWIKMSSFERSPCPSMMAVFCAVKPPTVRPIANVDQAIPLPVAPECTDECVTTECVELPCLCAPLMYSNPLPTCVPCPDEVDPTSRDGCYACTPQYDVPYDFQSVLQSERYHRDVADVAAIETFPATSSTLLLLDAASNETGADKAGEAGKPNTAAQSSKKANAPADGKKAGKMAMKAVEKKTENNNKESSTPSKGKEDDVNPSLRKEADSIVKIIDCDIHRSLVGDFTDVAAGQGHLVEATRLFIVRRELMSLDVGRCRTVTHVTFSRPRHCTYGWPAISSTDDCVTSVTSEVTSGDQP